MQEQLSKYKEQFKMIRKSEVDITKQLKQKQEKSEKLEAKVIYLKMEFQKANIRLSFQ